MLGSFIFRSPEREERPVPGECAMNCADAVAVFTARVAVIDRPVGGRRIPRCVRGGHGTHAAVHPQSWRRGR